MLPDTKKKKTCVRKNTCNPLFEKNDKAEPFTWELRTGEDLDQRKLFLSIWDKSALRKNQFMGAMTFNVAEIFEGDIQSGWFRVLDQKRGEFTNWPFKNHKKDDGASYRVTDKGDKYVPVDFAAATAADAADDSGCWL